MNTPVATESVLHLIVPEVENNSAVTLARFSLNLLRFCLSFIRRVYSVLRLPITEASMCRFREGLLWVEVNSPGYGSLFPYQSIVQI